MFADTIQSLITHMPEKAQAWVMNFMDLEYGIEHHISDGVDIFSILDNSHFHHPNFLYDKKTGFVLCNFGVGYHQMAMAKLYSFHKAMESKGDDFAILDVFDSTVDDGDLADKYIDECHGFFQSSVSSYDCMTLSENYNLSFQEKKVFAGFRHIRI